MKPFGKISGRAFTLVELLVVMVIIGILIGITMGIYGTIKRKGVESRLKAELAAIELGLENFKAMNGNYPYSGSWNYEYPPKSWVLSLTDPQPLENQLYKYLVKDAEKKPHLPDVKASQYKEGEDYLLAPVTAVRRPTPNSPESAQWYYNFSNPRYNKNSYDLWVEYGDFGEDGVPSPDDTVRIISNWNK